MASFPRLACATNPTILPATSHWLRQRAAADSPISHPAFFDPFGDPPPNNPNIRTPNRIAISPSMTVTSIFDDNATFWYLLHVKMETGIYIQMSVRSRLAGLRCKQKRRFILMIEGEVPHIGDLGSEGINYD
jgi:hypothetical protein